MAWAGLRLPVPEVYRPARTEGDYVKGLIVLSDDQRARLVIAWATVTRKKFDPQEFCRTKLLSLFGKSSKIQESHVVKVKNASFTTLVSAASPEDKVIRTVGYCPTTRRVIDILYHTGTAREDLIFNTVFLPGLCDQPIDSDYRWSILGSSMTIPAGFKYLESRLNLGDQTLRFVTGKSEGNSPLLLIRQVYPASLALNRQPLADWLEDWVTGPGASYAPRTKRVGFRFPPFIQETKLVDHDAVYVNGSLRWPLRLTRWWMPRKSCFYAVHIKPLDRILMIQVSGPADLLEGWATGVAASYRLSAAITP
jgi:hypothetical protein